MDNCPVFQRSCGAAKSKLAIGLDIGGTKVSAAVVTDRGQVLDDLTVRTPHDRDITPVLLDLINQLRRRQPTVEAVGVGAAGIVEWPCGIVRWAPNNSYQQLPLRDLLQKATDLPVVVDNDANTAGWAESVFGCDGPHNDIVFLTVGTGLGAGLILNGDVYRGRTGIATEVGHMIVDPHGGRWCGCGNQGCLEALASGTALERRAQLAISQHPSSLLAQLAGSDQGHLTGRLVHTAARGGDPVAIELLTEVGYWLGIGIASLINIFEIEAVIVGGGLAETGDLLLGPAQTAAHQYVFCKQHRSIPPILKATLGAEAGLIGAAHLALMNSYNQAPLAHPVLLQPLDVSGQEN
jgi:glucokinase